MQFSALFSYAGRKFGGAYILGGGVTLLGSVFLYIDLLRVTHQGNIGERKNTRIPGYVSPIRVYRLIG